MQAMRFFNNSGPVNDADHFCVPPIKRLDTGKVWQLILQKKYFLICGPKQSGKTSYLLALASLINRNNYAKCLYFNVESLRGVQENLEECMRSVLFEISSRARDTFGDEYLEDMVPGILQKRGPYQALNELLTQWSKRSDKPIVLLMDEIDTLEGRVLTSFLSQLRAGYDKRPALFPQSIIFCATHDVIDKQFNIKDASLRIGFLKREELDGMFQAYSNRHGIEVDKAVLDRIWQYSSGQPWIVSTLAGELLFEIVPAKGIRRVTSDQVDEAIGNVLVKMGNHLEYLASQLRDERLRKCLVPILSSSTMADTIGEEDFAFARELGLIRTDRTVELSNALYRDMIPRILYSPVMYLINLDAADFLRTDQSLDIQKLMRSFQLFYRNHIDRLVLLIDYGIAGYILVFEALLQKLVDASISVTCEYGVGQGRVVLRLTRSFPEPQKATFVLKLVKLLSIDQFRQIAPKLAQEAEEYLAPGPEELGDCNIVAINTNSELVWEGKAQFPTKDGKGRSLTIWGF